MSDLIDRQAAIDAFDCTNELIVGGEAYARNVVNYINKVVDKIKDLPSAQPEIIRCKDCKYFEYDHPYIVQGFPVLGHEVCTAWGDGCKTSEDGYCFLAERRERINHGEGA